MMTKNQIVTGHHAMHFYPFFSFGEGIAQCHTAFLIYESFSIPSPKCILVVFYKRVISIMTKDQSVTKQHIIQVYPFLSTGEGIGFATL